MYNLQAGKAGSIRLLMLMKKYLPYLLSVLLLTAAAPGNSIAQHHKPEHADLQPLVAQALRLEEALQFLGSSLKPDDSRQLKLLAGRKPDGNTASTIQQILDPYCIAAVEINPESRVKVIRGAAKPVLVQSGWKSFLVKVHNQAGVTAKLQTESPSAEPLMHMSSNDARARPENKISAGNISNRFLQLLLYRNRPMNEQLSGFPLEYVILQVYCRDKGRREAQLSFNVGEGSQDIGFRNAVSILFDSKPAVRVKLRIADADGKPNMASFVISDHINRLPTNDDAEQSTDYRLTTASSEFGVPSKQLTGLYPLPSRRLATTDPYPDFFFQPQIYRNDGETVELTAGHYQVEFTRGPEYIAQKKELVIPEGLDSMEVSFKLKRWINMSALGWFSGDHHVHAAGCSHYESPEEGVDPPAMLRQVQGEDLNMAAVLTWGPGWYHQKQNFTGQTSPLSKPGNQMHYDVEVSGFPSSHAGHLVLLNLKEDDYPSTTTIEDWPSWTSPVLQWARKQQALTGYAHSGWGLEPINGTTEMLTNVLPKMDGIGANEYIVTVTQNLIDFYSAGDTPAPWELNMWYHTLNCGFRTRLSGETDFPCIFDERVGIARSYFKATAPLNYEKYIDAIKNGKSYVSDGRSHLIDFSVNGKEMGEGNSQLDLSAPSVVKVKAKAVAMLPETQLEEGVEIASRSLDKSPYWHIERARKGSSRNVSVELIFNGKPVDSTIISANGKWNELEFKYTVKESGWFALRIFPSAHTNPVFVVVNQAPVRVAESINWCIGAVDQCWKNKQGQIRKEELSAAESTYKQASGIYNSLK